MDASVLENEIRELVDQDTRLHVKGKWLANLLIGIVEREKGYSFQLQTDVLV